MLPLVGLLVLVGSSFGLPVDTKNVEVCVNGPYNEGTGGISFTDEWYARQSPITGFKIRYSNLIHGIQFDYGAYDAPYHGGDGGTEYVSRLFPGELITGIDGTYMWGHHIRSLTFRTNQRTLTFGPTTGHTGSFSMSYSTGLGWVSGASSTYLHSIAFHFYC